MRLAFLLQLCIGFHFLDNAKALRFGLLDWLASLGVLSSWTGGRWAPGLGLWFGPSRSFGEARAERATQQPQRLRSACLLLGPQSRHLTHSPLTQVMIETKLTRALGIRIPVVQGGMVRRRTPHFSVRLTAMLEPHRHRRPG